MIELPTAPDARRNPRTEGARPPGPDLLRLPGLRRVATTPDWVVYARASSAP